ncbi:hypothetical protein M8J75_013708 [Diaphorina citri]|nr:hypothetical protein M8J75_013708 [Diaphorina citri]
MRSATDEISASKLVEITTEACDRVLPKKKMGNNKWKPVPWWTENINTLRKDCIRRRRILTRSKKRLDDPEAIEKLLKEYKDAKTKLNSEIRNSRETEWKTICNEVEDDIWGRGYKIVTKKYSRKNYSIAPEKQKPILERLFPKHEKVTWERNETEENIEEFSMDELANVLTNIKKKRAPGPDGITPEILRIAVETIPDYVLGVMNEVLRTGKFPDEWKVAKVVLILKPGKPELEPSSYRPLCLLDTYGKFLENRCMFCEEADTAEHTFFSCSKWTMYRAEMEREIGQQLTVGNLCNEMLKSERNWEAIARCMNRIMKDKEAEERRRKEQNSTTNR